MPSSDSRKSVIKKDEFLLEILSTSVDETQIKRKLFSQQNFFISENYSEFERKLKIWLVRRITGRTEYREQVTGIRSNRSGHTVNWFDRFVISYIGKRHAEAPRGFRVTPDSLSVILKSLPGEIEEIFNARSGIKGFDL